jgi:hypothetical protein
MKFFRSFRASPEVIAIVAIGAAPPHMPLLLEFLPSPRTYQHLHSHTRMSGPRTDKTQGILVLQKLAAFSELNCNNIKDVYRL